MTTVHGPLRRAATGILLVAALAALIVGLVRVDVRTDLDSFLPADDPVGETYDDLTATFGGDPVVVLLESDTTDLLEPEALAQVVQLEGAISRLDDVAAVYGPGTLLNQLAGRAQDLLAQLFGRRDAEVEQARQAAAAAGASQAAIDAAGSQVQATFDARYGPLLVSGLPGGLPTLSNPKFVQTVVLNEDGLPRGQWQFVVPERDAVAITIRPREGLDAHGAEDLVRAIEEAVAEAEIPQTTSTVTGASAMVAAMSNRALDDMPLLGGLAVLLIGACFWSATWIRRSRRLAPMATTLLAIAGTISVLGWLDRPVSLAIVAFLPVLLGLGCYYPTYLVMGARPRTFVTVVLASSASFATLALAPLPLVRDLGLTMACGVLLAGGLAWVLRHRLVDSFVADPRLAVTRPPTIRHRRLWRGLAVAMAALALLGWVRLDDLAINSEVDEFATGLPELAEARHVEDIMGSAGEVSIVLRGSDVLTPEAYAWSRSALESVVVNHGDTLRPIVAAPSILSFLGSEPSADQIDAAYRLLPMYLTTSVVSADRATGVMTFGVKLDDLGSLDTTLDEAVAGFPDPPSGYTVEVAGLPVVLARGESLVSDDRYLASAGGILAAGLVLAIGLRRRIDALRGAAAAAMATGLGFAVLSLTGGGLNPITATLGALTAAIGCEFAVMLAEAVRGNRRLATAVPLVAATSVLGYAVLLASGLPAVRSFGVFLGGSVVAAVIAAWLVVAATVDADVPAERPAREDEATSSDNDSDQTVSERRRALV